MLRRNWACREVMNAASFSAMWPSTVVESWLILACSSHSSFFIRFIWKLSWFLMDFTDRDCLKLDLIDSSSSPTCWQRESLLWLTLSVCALLKPTTALNMLIEFNLVLYWKKSRWLSFKNNLDLLKEIFRRGSLKLTARRVLSSSLHEGRRHIIEPLEACFVSTAKSTVLHSYTPIDLDPATKSFRNCFDFHQNCRTRNILNRLNRQRTLKSLDVERESN